MKLSKVTVSEQTTRDAVAAGAGPFTFTPAGYVGTLATFFCPEIYVTEELHKVVERLLSQGKRELKINVDVVGDIDAKYLAPEYRSAK